MTKHTASPRIHDRDLHHPTVTDDKRASTSVNLKRFRSRTAPHATETDAVCIDPSDALFPLQTFRSRNFNFCISFFFHFGRTSVNQTPLRTLDHKYLYR